MAWCVSSPEGKDLLLYIQQKCPTIVTKKQRLLVDGKLRIFFQQSYSKMVTKEVPEKEGLIEVGNLEHQKRRFKKNIRLSFYLWVCYVWKKL